MFIVLLQHFEKKIGLNIYLRLHHSFSPDQLSFFHYFISRIMSISLQIHLSWALTDQLHQTSPLLPPPCSFCLFVLSRLNSCISISLARELNNSVSRVVVRKRKVDNTYLIYAIATGSHLGFASNLFPLRILYGHTYISTEIKDETERNGRKKRK